MHQLTTPTCWENRFGKIGLHPSKRGSKPDPKKARVIGVMPRDCGWSPGERGFITAMKGLSEDKPFLYIFPEAYLDNWLNSNFDRALDQIVQFKLEETYRFGKAAKADNPVVQAMRSALRMEFFGHTNVTYYTNTGTSRSLKVLVPARRVIQPYKPTKENRK